MERNFPVPAWIPISGFLTRSVEIFAENRNSRRRPSDPSHQGRICVPEIRKKYQIAEFAGEKAQRVKNDAFFCIFTVCEKVVSSSLVREG